MKEISKQILKGILAGALGAIIGLSVFYFVWKILLGWPLPYEKIEENPSPLVSSFE